MTYHNAVKYILTSPDKNGSASSLERITLLGERLCVGHKHLKYLRFAGSNGKTVCLALLTNILVKNGTKTGCLIMPTLSEPRHNVLIDGEPISISDTVKYVSRIAAEVSALRNEISDLQQSYDPEQYSEGIPEAFAEGKLDITPTKNEIILLVALLAFREAHCELCLIECEHDGADPTKFLGAPICTAICGAIPAENTKEAQRIKSYIKNGTPEVVSAPQSSETYKIISDACAQSGARLSVPARSSLTVKRLSLTGSVFSYKDSDYTLGVCGRFQIHNATTVLEMVQMLRRNGFDISDSAVEGGLKTASIRSRFETISVNPTIIADSTHKLEAVDTMCHTLEDFKEQTGDTLTLCLTPDLPLINAYMQSLTSMGYTVKKIIVVGADPDFSNKLDGTYGELSMPASYKETAKQILSEGHLTLISGTADITGAIRQEIIRILEF